MSVRQESFVMPPLDLLGIPQKGSTESTVIEGHQTTLFKYEYSENIYTAVVELDFGYLQVNSGGSLSQEEFIEAVRAIIK